MALNPYYLAILDGREGAYGVSFPDLGGCLAMGFTQEEARANAAEALEEWIGDAQQEGFMPAYIRNVEELFEDEDVREIIGYGGKMIAVPYKESPVTQDLQALEHAFIYQAFRSELAKVTA